MITLTSFPSFPLLPTELQLKIFHHASNASPRVLDIWTSFQKRETGNTIFYIQHYESEVSPSSRVAPALLSVSKAARSECLKCYSMEFVCEMTITGSGDRDGECEDNEEEVVKAEKFSTPPRMWINFNIDVLVPRGFWNIVSFPDFASRVYGRMRCVALDVEGAFWKDNLRDYCRMKCWALNGVEEVLLYSSSKSSERDLWRRNEHLDSFRQRETGKRELRFSPLLEETSDEERKIGTEDLTCEIEILRSVERLLGKVFDAIEGEEPKDGDEDFMPVRKAEFVSMELTTKAEFRRPVIKLMRFDSWTPEDYA
ncbi:hypothetical protein VTL71DRAFT_6293 [Oculimacula yallundae]|uniref:2EXR domain-containing protein n=1 Tax=Oculimacula yallundae TaxID=86028 RepID=A0ABR4BXF9_9HELO